ncbi:cupin [candidate division MSBL1 archaeon SCGC-AAA382A13]|uniref:Cupin n=1 Tax=candidate division MSBL1 archaeon SCGC-AAA382A13 TaxID=1698279 RepID=A0A133VFC3_9EURY|nr:cupin [candidate division MSBL1 archaeon SCGC-AAA382A13]
MNRENDQLDDIKTEVFKLEDLVEYQKNSVVSKTLIDRESGTLTLFALDRGQSISEHSAPYDALVLILDGEAKITISGQDLELESGESTVMPANEPHSLEAQKRFKMLLIMIR